VLQRVLCRALVGRSRELSALEDQLLAARRGESRFVLVAGEAGLGKTRLTNELAERASGLGFAVLRGSCSEAELALPYLPFVEAVGNYLATRDAAEVGALLGPVRRDVAAVFPQLGGDDGAPASGDVAQAKLRLFEGIVALLAVPARAQGLVLVVEDVHWADASTRELLDHLARRLHGLAALVVCTYRSDELDRRHPLLPVLQAWRRSGLAETVELDPLPPRGVAEMISSILDDDEVGEDFRDLMHARSEGNPFVLEELLKDAIDGGDVFQSGDGWDRRSLEDLRLPETVRDTILLRLGRLEDDHVEVLRAGAVLGRSFDYETLAEVTGADERTLDGALTAAVAQQLLDEDATTARFTWRHALTQEAIASDIVAPRRQRIHARAADAVARTGGSAIELARHLLGAGRFEEAVPACLLAADEAERALAFGEAAELLERALPYVADPAEEALLLCRMGRLRWLNGESEAAHQLLEDGVERLEEIAGPVAAAEFRLVLGRCHWELERPDRAMEEYERARSSLEPAGPSAPLALAYMRIAGLRTFELDDEGAAQAARRAVEIAEAAGADFERVYALAFLCLALFTLGEIEEGTKLADKCFEEAVSKGYFQIAWNTVHNETWQRVHLVAGGLERLLEKLDGLVYHPWSVGAGELARSWIAIARGDPHEALAQAEDARAALVRVGRTKLAWRADIAVADALAELGRYDDALRILPSASTRTELQDIVYDASARIHALLARGRTAEALALGREIASHTELDVFRGIVRVAVEALVAGGALEEAAALVARSRARPHPLGRPALDEAEGRIALAQGRAAEARALLERAASDAAAITFEALARSARILLAEALVALGEREAAANVLGEVAAEAHAADAGRLVDETREVAERRGLPLPELEPASEPVSASPDVLAAGERLVSSMFADVRGSTALAGALSPEELANRLSTLHRWATAEVTRRHGVVDKFAGDAVMATFNVGGARTDHAIQALDAAVALRDKAALAGVPIGIGIAVGPAIVTRTTDGANVSVLGVATNLAARLQAAAASGEVILSEEAYRRAATSLAERGLVATRETLELKGFETPQVAYRLASG